MKIKIGRRRKFIIYQWGYTGSNKKFFNVYFGYQ